MSAPATLDAASFGDLRVGAAIHEGPRTTIYHAVRERDGARFVLKVLKPGFDDDTHRARLEREYAVTCAVDDAVVVKAHGLTTYEGRLALVLEDFGGRSLDLALHPPVPMEQLLPIAVKIAAALVAVHARGIVHRDVKPSNLLIGLPAVTVKITDFGIAAVRGSGRSHAAASLEGSLAYIAPEQTGRIRRTVDHRADLYAFGVTLYELATGERPFRARDALEWIHCHLARVAVAPCRVNPSVPGPISDLIERLLQKAPEERYQSAAAVQRDLERCARAFATTGRIAPFPLASAETSEEFVVSQRMHGREHELATMRRAFERVVAAAGSEILLVAGHSGVGKSSLARELNQNVAERHGLFLAGKFEQYRRHVPYSAFVQAGRELVQLALATHPDKLLVWKAELVAALAGNGQVIADVLPEVELLIGRQPPSAPLGAAETQRRFHFAVRALLRTFAKFGPLVLFWDDLQWADQGSLDLVEALFADRSLGPVLAVLAYREHEVPETHAFATTLQRLRSGGAPVEMVRVLPLAEASVRAIVAETLRVPEEECADFAATVFARTSGNPFFVTEYLSALYAEGFLRLDPSTRAFRWELGAVEAMRISSNVVELMLHRLRKLPDASRDALRIAACVGADVDLDDLAAVLAKSPREAARDLEPCIEAGFLLAEADADGRLRARFRHDRIQQAAYALLAASERSATHLRIGRRLWARLDTQAGGARLFDVANHLDMAFDAIVEPGERERLLALELSAGRSAKAVNAYALACKYFARAREILSDSGWQTRFEDTFALAVELAECRYLAGELEQARALFAELEQRSRTSLERARIYYLQIRLLQVAGDFANAALLSLRSFELFGLTVPRTAEDAARAVEHEHAEVTRMLGDRPILERALDPEMTDPSVRMLADLLESSGPPIYMVEPALFPWVALKLVGASLQHGNSPASCYGYGIYALLRAAVMGDVEGGYELSQLAIRLNERLGSAQLAGCMLHLLGDHVNFWKNPIATDLPILERGFAACVRGGDHIYSNYIGFQAPWHLYESGAPLDDVWKLTLKYESFAVETRYAPVRWTIRTEQQFIRALKGKTRAPTSFSDDVFNEAEALAEMSAARFGCGVVYYHIMKLVAAFTYGEYERALSSAHAALLELGSAFSMPIYVTFTLYQALTLAVLHPHADPQTQASYLETLQAAHRTISGWARGCPENFADKAALLGAELAVLSGDTRAAMGLYERARLLARAQRFTQYEALAVERAASLYASAGVASMAEVLLRDAHALYLQWGALGKADDLTGRHPALITTVAVHDRSSSSLEASTTSATARHLDVLSVVKAAQSISAEMVLPRLLERLMAIVIEYAGAERGLLVLLEGDSLVVAARAGGELGALTPAGVVSEGLPTSILSHVRRSGEHLLLEDARAHNPFASDPYFATGSPRSVLCQPIARQGRLVGMFYLENTLVAGAFGPERLTILEVLASQTAISIENSRLYAASQAAVLARDEFLSIASHELKTPLTPMALHLQNLIGLIRKGTLRSTPEERLVKLASTCDAQLGRLTRLVEALLDVSRISTGTLALHPSSVDLGKLAAEVVEQHEAQLASAGCALELDIEPSVIGWWDRGRLAEVVTKLLLNAAKFGKGKPVGLSVRKEGGAARLQVRDAGVGVSLENQARIFRRFERVQSTTNVDGLGLGLFIVRALVEAHGGQVSIDSRPGHGASFDVVLPLAAEQEGGLGARAAERL